MCLTTLTIGPRGLYHPFQMVMKDEAERGRMGELFFPSKNLKLSSKDLNLQEEVLVMYYV